MRLFRSLWVVVSLILPTLLSARVIWWENFEDSTLNRISWGGAVSLIFDPPYVQDDPAGFRRQNHGIVSLQVSSAADSSWVAFPCPAAPAFPELLELYLNLPEAGDGLSGAQWDIHRLKIRLRALGSTHYALEVLDSTGTHLFTSDSLVPDTVVHPQNWYRLQVLLTDTLDFVYLNGHRLGHGFVPLQRVWPDSTRWVLPPGTEGTVLLDDYVVATPDYHAHPNLLFGLEDLPLLLFKSVDPSPGTSGIVPAELWDSLQAMATRYLYTDTLVLLDGSVRYPYPFPWPPPLWSGLLYQAHIPHWVQSEGFVYALTYDTAHAAKVAGILQSLSNWPQLEWPYYYHNPTPLYMETDGFHYLLTLTLGYDLVYNALSDFDRMSLENALLVKGVQQADLSLRVGNLSTRPVLSNKALVGAASLLLACLAVEDSAYTTGPRATALQILQDFFSNPGESFSSETGDARENSFFTSYAFVHLAMAAEALERRGDSWLREQMDPFVGYRTTLALPGLRQYPPVGDNSAVFQGYMEQSPELLAFLASRGANSLAQWYLSQISSYTFDYGQGLWGDYLVFGTFLWLDNTLPTLPPDSSGLPLLQRFPVTGLSVYRSAWQDPRTLFVALKSRDAGAYHNHLDNNTLYIALGPHWVIGEDTYRHLPYTERHSTLLVFYQNDTLGQVWKTDGGTVFPPYRDSTGALLEAEAQGSYQTVSLFRRRIWILPGDTLVLVWDRVTSPPEYAARYQLRYHLFGTAAWLGDTLELFQDSVHARLWWISPFAVEQHLETRPTDTVWTITSLQDSTEFEGVAAIALAPALAGTPELTYTPQGTLLRYKSHRLLEVSPLARDSLALQEFYGQEATWTLLNLAPNTSYVLLYVGQSVAGALNLTTDAYGRTGFALHEAEDTLELYLLRTDTPCYPTRPTTQNRVYGHDPNGERWVYGKYHQVFDRWLRYEITRWLDVGDYPLLSRDESPRAVYYQRRRGRWNLVVRNLADTAQVQVLNIWNDTVRREPPAAWAAGDSLWIAHWLIFPDSSARLLQYRLFGTHSQVDTLDRSSVPPPAFSTPSFARSSSGLWLAWVHPGDLVSRLYLARLAPGPPVVETLWTVQNPGEAPCLYADGSRLYLAWQDGDTLWYSLREGSTWRTPELVDTSLGHPVFLTAQHLLASTLGKRPGVVLYAFNGARFAPALTLADGEDRYGTGRVLQESNGSMETRILWSHGTQCLRDTLLKLRLRNFVSGHISESVTWKDTVYVNGDLVVDSGAVLRLMPGTVVQVTPHFDYLQTGRDTGAVEIVVQGTLVARGHIRNPVYFKGEGEAGSWEGIRVEPGGCDTLIGTRLYDAAHGLVALAGSQVYLDTTYLWNLDGWAVYAESAYVEIANSHLLAPRGTLLEGCTGSLVACNLQGKPQALTVRAPSGYLLLQDNRIYVHTTIGLSLESTGRRVDLFENHIQGSDIGVYLLNSSPLMSDNQILLTKVASVWTAGLSVPRLRHNHLHSLRFPVIATDGSRPLLGREGDPHSGLNSILSDSARVIYVPGEYTTGPLEAEENWWGTPSPGPALFLGPVDYIPYLHEPTGPAGGNAGLAFRIHLDAVVVRHTVVLKAEAPVSHTLDYTVYDVSGRRVLHGTLSPGWHRRNLTVAGLRSGVYFLRLQQGNRTVLQRRFVKL